MFYKLLAQTFQLESNSLYCIHTGILCHTYYYLTFIVYKRIRAHVYEYRDSHESRRCRHSICLPIAGD